MFILEREQILPRSPGEVFEFFADAHNLEAITPPWLGFSVITPAPIQMGAGTLIEYRLRLHGVLLRWLTRIEVWERGQRFVDVQVRGPYRLWHHTHTFSAHPDGTSMRDVVRYSLPFRRLGRLAGSTLVHRDLQRIFDFRRDAVARRFA